MEFEKAQTVKDKIAAVQARGHDPVDDNEADALALLLWAIEQHALEREA